MIVLPVKNIIFLRIENPKYFHDFPDSNWRDKFPKSEAIKDLDVFHCYLLPDEKDGLLALSNDRKKLVFSYTFITGSKPLRKSVQIGLVNPLDSKGKEIYVTTIGYLPYLNSDRKNDVLLSSRTRTIVKTISKILDNKPYNELESTLKELGNKAFMAGIKLWGR